VSRPKPALCALAACLLSLLAGTPAAAVAAPPPALDVTASALIAANTGQQLSNKNADAERPIASTTKLMTALVALQHARLGQGFTAPPVELAADDSQIGLEAGERMTVGDLVIAMMLPSGDDAAYDLAYNVGGHSVPRFVAMMNVEAAALGLRHTHYSTPVGLDTPGNYSTASDLVALTQYLLRTQPFLRHAVDQPRARIRIGTSTRVVENLNTLVGRVPWVNGVKTGHTLGAGYVLVGSGTRGHLTLISAVLGAPTETARESDTLALLKWGFGNFHLVSPVTIGQTVATRPVQGRPGQRAALIATGSYRRVVPRDTPVRTVVYARKQLTGPLPRGAVAGTVAVFVGGAQLASFRLRLARSVPAPPPGVSATTIAGPFTLVLLVLLLGVITVRGRRGRLMARRAAGRQRQ
jgi:D-alanyl-D-alanine carboxypeptidase (penicillin-binding protein 5/6)